MSKILILSAGTSKDSHNSQLARHLSDHMSENNLDNNIYYDKLRIKSHYKMAIIIINIEYDS